MLLLKYKLTTSSGIHKATILPSCPHSSLATHQTIRLNLTLSILLALWGSGTRKDQRGFELTLTMEETESSRLDPEMQQKTPTPLFCQQADSW